MSEYTLGCITAGGKVLLLVFSSLGCCQTSYNAQDNPFPCLAPVKKNPNVNGVAVEKSRSSLSLSVSSFFPCLSFIPTCPLQTDSRALKKPQNAPFPHICYLLSYR